METYGTLKQAAGHYSGEKGFCSVVAVAVAAGCKFGKARAAMSRAGRKSGRGATIYEIHRAVEEFGLLAICTPEHAAACRTLATATRCLPSTGTFFLYTRGHVSCVRDGVLEDWAAERGSRKRITAVFRIA